MEKSAQDIAQIQNHRDRLLDKMEASAGLRSKPVAPWQAITSARRLIAANLKGFDLEEAFGILSFRQQRKFLNLLALSHQ